LHQLHGFPGGREDGTDEKMNKNPGTEKRHYLATEFLKTWLDPNKIRPSTQGSTLFPY
jgi:hypothetical protein